MTRSNMPGDSGRAAASGPRRSQHRRPPAAAAADTAPTQWLSFRRRPGHVLVALVSVLALVVTGVAWRSVDSIRTNLATVADLGLGNGADGAVDILMVGTDSRTDAHGNALSQTELDSLRAGEEVASNTDTIVLIRVPNDGSSATALSIPRDAYVDVPGIGMSKINAAYGATKERKRLQLVESGVTDADADTESTKDGRQALIDSVASLTGITVDHYAEVGLLGFVLLTNAVGGVNVCLTAPVDEPLSGANFPAGPQSLQGADALSFVRQRHDLPRGDLDRIVRQQVFMASLVREVLSAKTLSNPGKLGQLASAIERSVVLDDDWDILDFATRLQDVAGGEVKFETVPVVDINAVTDYGESIVQVDPAAVKSYVDSLVGDDAGAESTEETSAPSVDASSVTVDVANDSGIDGLASSLSDALSAQGYRQGVVGNNEGASVDTTTVFSSSTDSDAAEALAAGLGDVSVEVDESLAPGTVRVVIATDYAGPGSSSGSEFAGETGSSSETSGISPAGAAPTPAPPAPAIDAGTAGPPCIN